MPQFTSATQPAAHFPFNREFQSKILGLMYSDFDFLSYAQEILHPDYFADNALAWFFTSMKNYFIDYQMRMDEQSLRNELRKAVVKKKIKDNEISSYVSVFKSIKEKVPNKQYISDEVTTFCKHQAIKKTALELPGLLQANDFGAIEAAWKEAFQVGIVQDIGTEYFLHYPERIKRKALVSARKVMPVGITDLDIILGGGLKPKQLGLWMGPTNRGKCLQIGTKVLKYDGSLVNVEDVVAGDQLMGPDSKPRTVLGTTRGVGPLYKINPSRADSWVCNEPHILTLVNTETDAVIDIPLPEYQKKSNRFKHCHKQFSVGVNFPPLKNPLPIDPYFLGVWFGDGTKALGSVTVTKGDSEIKDLMYTTAKKFNLQVREQIDEGKCPQYHITAGNLKGVNPHTRNPLLLLLREVVGEDCKIPYEYLVSSLEDRKAFLAGFLDTDGHLHNNTFDIAQKRKDYAEAICFIARSLGLRASLNSKEVSGYGTYWRVTITGALNQLPVRIKRKQPGPRKRKTDVTRHAFKVIPIGEGEYAGFELDGDGRFLLGDFTVTHNTLALIHCGKRAIIAGRSVLHYTLEMSEDDVSERYDSAFSKIPMSALADREADLVRSLDDFGARWGNSLIIKEFPTKKATVGMIMAHYRMCVQTGFNPDLVLVDYLNLIKPSNKRMAKREELTDTAEELRGCAGETGIPWWTATQSRRGAISMETHGEDEVGEDIGMINTSDITITLNQTEDELHQEIMRCYVAKNRNGPKYRMVKIATRFDRMCFYDPIATSAIATSVGSASATSTTPKNNRKRTPVRKKNNNSYSVTTSGLVRT